MKKVQRLTGIVTTMILAVSLVGCAKPEPDPNSGMYEAVSAEMMGMAMDVSDIYENGVSFELKDGGKCEANMDGETAGMKWEVNGDSIHLKGGGVELDGTIGGGELVLENMLDMGVNMTFKCTEPAHPELLGETASGMSGAAASGNVLDRLKRAQNGETVYYPGGGSSSDIEVDWNLDGWDTDDWNSLGIDDAEE